MPDNRGSRPQGYLIASAEDLTHYLIAQLNEGSLRHRERDRRGLAMLHQPAVATDEGTTAYAMGWKIGPLDGVPAIWHDGSVFNFHAISCWCPRTGGAWLSSRMSTASLTRSAEHIV